VEQIIKALQKTYEYVVIDTPAAFDENVLSALDLASQIHLVLTMDLPAIKNAKLCLEVLEGLGLKEKVRIILNNSCSDYGLRAEDVERTLGLPILCQLPPSDKVVITAVNRGTPFVVTNPTAKISENIEQLARMVVKKAKTAAAQNKKPGLLASMFSL
jgi:pilus assembly protein CpaE